MRRRWAGARLSTQPAGGGSAYFSTFSVSSPQCYLLNHRLNMELDLQSILYLGSCVPYSCTHWLRPRNSPSPPPSPRILRSYTRAHLVSQDRRHLFVTSCFKKLANSCKTLGILLRLLFFCPRSGLFWFPFYPCSIIRNF